MSAERALRQCHAQALLDGLHPQHCGNFPAALHERARHSALGRRHLTRAALARAPALFEPDQERWQAWQDDQPWLLWPQPRLMDFTRELGALSLAPALRVVLERNAVLFLREAVGAELWRLVQAADPWRGRASETIRLMGNALLQRCGHDAAALRSSLFERGKIEFLGHAERAGGVLAARLGLAYAAIPAEPCARECWLPADAVAQRLAHYVGLAAEVAGDDEAEPAA
ncbi:hypothetical protein ASG87_17755 [Frateuria sp. Soil773]|uniref:hypothetical protein n=1 Tax=Frateuria sp. Soil773 TaxID=1736407 RepID=UPI0007020931|nr:hypothetical protein [Frateuria sp. Soil773]KRE94448.1 hypothetical protein ASG87_17755 [Frateuria sp. Soil773]